MRNLILRNPQVPQSLKTNRHRRALALSHYRGESLSRSWTGSGTPGAQTLVGAT